MTKQTDEQIYTTRGKSFMAKVHEPETSKLFPSAGPMFQTSVLYPSEDDEEFKKIRALIKQYKAPMRPAEHKDSDGNETGEMRVTFSRRAFKDENDKVQNYPIIVDKYGDPLPKDKLIGNGSDII